MAAGPEGAIGAFERLDRSPLDQAEVRSDHGNLLNWFGKVEKRGTNKAYNRFFDLKMGHLMPETREQKEWT